MHRQRGPRRRWVTGLLLAALVAALLPDVAFGLEAGWARPAIRSPLGPADVAFDSDAHIARPRVVRGLRIVPASERTTPVVARAARHAHVFPAFHLRLLAPRESSSESPSDH